MCPKILVGRVSRLCLNFFVVSMTLSIQKRSHLLVDARPLDGTRNGLARFVENLVLELPNVTQARISLISNRAIVTVHPLPSAVDVFVDGGVWGRVPGSIWLNLRAKAIAKRLGATHILGTQHVLPVFGLKNQRRAVIVHDLVFRRFPETMLWSNRLFSNLLIPRSLRVADSIFCISETTRSDLQEEFGIPCDTVRVVYPGMTFDGGAGKVLNSETSVRLLVVGSMEPRKNFAKFFRAFLILRSKGLAIGLDVVSGGGWGNVLSQDLRLSLEADPLVCFHLRANDERLCELYARADFLIFPSLYEGFGLPMLEAIGRCGIIANDIPVFREISGHLEGVGFVDFCSEEQVVAEKMVANLLGPKMVARFRSSADRELFSWRRCAQTISSGMGL